MVMQLFLVCSFFFLTVTSAVALEVDEKLTLRLLNVSQTRKTVLVNRGQEDGLVENDHAKFFTSVGVVARGVLVKISPTRSVWGLYRIVSPEFIKNDQVMNLKITPPVKISADDSKMIIKEDIPPSDLEEGEDPEALGISLAEGADDLTPEERERSKTRNKESSKDQSEKDELRALMSAPSFDLARKNFEFFGVGSLASWSQSTKGSNLTGGRGPYGSSSSASVLDLGLEFYFRDTRPWFHRFSISPFYRMSSMASFTAQGHRASTEAREYGASIYWHPFKKPSEHDTLIPFVGLSYAFGSIADTFTYNPQSGSLSETLQGSSRSFGFQGGFKYYFYRGFGVRLLVDYSIRGEVYPTDSSQTSWARNTSGYQVLVGFSYRF